MINLQRTNIKRFVKKNTPESIILFLLSPFIGLLFQIYFIIRGNRIALNLLILTLGLVGYIFVPSYTNDKTRYYERYQIFKHYNFNDYIRYLIIENKPDFIFDSLIYFTASNGINIQVLFFLIATFSIYSVFKVTDLITDYFESNKRTICFLLILFSFALQHLYSGIRFTFASCIFLWAVYFIEYKKKWVPGMILLFLSLATHFSMVLMSLAFLGYKFFHQINFKSVFYVSFVFLIIPQELLINYVNLIDIDSGFTTYSAYERKVKSYVNEEDFITRNFDNSIASVIVYYVRNIWVYVAYVFLLFESKNKENRILQLLFLIMATANVFYAFPTVYSRYLIFVKFIFTIYLIHRYLINKNSRILLFLGIYFISFIVECYITRPNLLATFLDSSNISLITILMRDVGLEHIIYNR